ncbi:MAG: V-type ATPase subunit [Spirochaetaceae bacterium]|jgi:vacuolar-type H+-ATPase subunit C/Vma6|nr:V-type ATPase subunit [Spirochaetaceae bacterium]
MPSGEQAYAFAKACGIIGKSFVGKRMSRLRSVGRLTELDRLVFPRSSRDLPERELLRDLERRIIDRSVNQIALIVDSFANPPELLIRLVRSYEYGDVKNALAGIIEGSGKKPEFTGLGAFGTVNFDAYPQIKDMFRGTEFAFLLDVDMFPEGEEGRNEGFLNRLQMELDRRYYTYLWNALFSLAPADRKAIERILSEEIALRNAAWSLRLRTYYGMAPQETEEFLIPIGIGRRYDGEGASPASRRGKTLADDARASLSMALDYRPDWEKWKRAALLNPEGSDEHWRADPRYFQNAASEYLYRLARRSFYRTPFTVDSIACFIKLKQFEEDILTSVAEGLGLGLSAEDIFSMLEVTP